MPPPSPSWPGRAKGLQTMPMETVHRLREGLPNQIILLMSFNRLTIKTSCIPDSLGEMRQKQEERESTTCSKLKQLCLVLLQLSFYIHLLLSWQKVRRAMHSVLVCNHCILAVVFGICCSHFKHTRQRSSAIGKLPPPL